MMNVLQVDFGAVQERDPEQLLDRFKSLTGWCESLLAAGAHQVDVVQRFHRNAAIERNAVTYRFVADLGSPFYPATSFARFRQAVESAHADIVHVNGLSFYLGTAWLRSILPRQTALILQDHADGSPRHALAGAIKRIALRRVDGYFFTAAEQAAPWRTAGIVGPRQRVYEILEASTSLRPIARTAARRASGIAGSPALLWVGRLDTNKDPMTVLAAFERFIVPYPDASLTMVFGSEDLLPQVRTRVAQFAALARRVRLVGRVPHDKLPAYYSAADIFVLGSHHEGSGYALIEACACGAIPVVTNIPTFRVITGDGAHGALWNPGDAAGCAQALLEIVSHDLGVLRGGLARHFARELSWAAVGRRALDIYTEVRARRGTLR